MAKTKRAAIILAAGKGTRMKSDLAKVLHEANGLPLAWYPIRRALDMGCDPVVVVVGHQGEEVRARLDALFPDAPLRFAVQAEQRGTGHAVLSARRALRGYEGRIQILYGDVPLLTTATLKRLARAGSRRKLAFLSMTPDDPTGYGRVIRAASGEVTAIVEQKDAGPSERAVRECNAGIYDCDSRFMWRALAKVTAVNAQGEFYLTDLVAAAAAAGEPAAVVEAPIDEVSGVNDRVELAQAALALRRRLRLRHMRAGVSLIDPDSVFLDEGVVLGQDVTIEPNVQIAGATRIGAGATIGFGSVIRDCTIGAGVKVRPYSVLEGAKVGDRAVVGPFARLRPETELAAEVHIGNFVEVKKSVLGKGAKANHLSYVGDAEVGAGSNIGAGTITCNYDGVNKHRTVLGEKVFIGSGTQLVAPLRIGDGAYVGAGSTLTQDVPSDALAVTRAPQLVKEGWATRKRAAQERRRGQVAARASSKSKEATKAKAAAPRERVSTARALGKRSGRS